MIIMPNSLSDEQYKAKMQRRKALQDERIAAAKAEKGLIIVNTGNGKGKTTAALGMVLRSLGHGYRVAILQFIKGAWEPAEKAAFDPWQDQLTFLALGKALPGKPKIGKGIRRSPIVPGNKRWVISAILTINWCY